MMQFHSNRMWGLAFEYHGMAIPEAAGLRLVYRQADKPVDILAEDCQVCVVPWQQIRSARLDRGMFGGTIVITVGHASLGPDLPFYRGEALLLEVHKSNLAEVEPFLQRMDKLRQGGRGEDGDVDQVIDDVRNFLEGFHGDILGDQE
jgi:hypothetical protein